MRRALSAAAASAALLLAACVQMRAVPPLATIPTLPPPPTVAALAASEMPPPPPREFRGAWVATVANIDWPSRPGLPADVQRAQALAILDRARDIGLNAIILQVRAEGDAFYPSTLEPWSEYLSGEQGRPPYAANEPAYDPLAFWVEQAHQRGLELHAWFNPYRARHSSAKSPLAQPHLALRQPALVKRYANMLWTDPGEPAAAQHMLAVVSDVVRRYDIDGVHIDDYFYPYPVVDKEGVDTPFPDDPAWARYRLEGGSLARDDWRRANVDLLVQALHRTVQQIKPWVSFGVSPFGIGKPELRPAGISGFSQYDKLYADVEKWFHNGWLDYLVPQLYWPIDRQGQEFPALLDYWLANNRAQRHLWPGLFTSLVRDEKKNEALGRRVWPAQEIVEQVSVQRSRSAATRPSTGHVHFSMVALMNNKDGLATLLRQGPYAQPALVPATPWLQAPAVLAPRLWLQAGQVAIDPLAPAAVARWAVWRRGGTSGVTSGVAIGVASAANSAANSAATSGATSVNNGGEWRFAVLPAAARSVSVDGADAVVVAAVDRVGNLGPQSSIRIK